MLFPRLAQLRPWLVHLRAGDWLVMALGCAACVGATVLLWQGDVPDKAIVRAGGKVVAEVSLLTPRFIEVDGPIGKTRIEIQPGRARVASDPGPRQYCVRQGWLTRGGAVAICAPNHVSLTLSGRKNEHDTISY